MIINLMINLIIQCSLERIKKSIIPTAKNKIPIIKIIKISNELTPYVKSYMYLQIIQSTMFFIELSCCMSSTVAATVCSTIATR